MKRKRLFIWQSHVLSHGFLKTDQIIQCIISWHLIIPDSNKNSGNSPGTHKQKNIFELAKHSGQLRFSVYDVIFLNTSVTLKASTRIIFKFSSGIENKTLERVQDTRDQAP